LEDRECLFLLGTGGWETNESLEGVVEEPLETSQGTNHDNTNWETVPETAEADLGVDTGDSRAHGLGGLLLGVDLGDHDVGRVGDNGTEDTSNVTTKEGDTSLSVDRVFFLLLWKVSVDGKDSVFERGELNHGVWDLSEPQRSDTLVQTTETFSSNQFLETVHKARSVWWDGGLGLDLDGLPWTEKNISNELSRSRSNQEKTSLVLDSVLLTSPVGILLLEQLVETVFTGTLEGVTNQSGTETSEDTTQSLLGNDGSPGLEVALVKRGVNLSSALDQIQWGHGSVGQTTGYIKETLLAHFSYFFSMFSFSPVFFLGASPQTPSSG
jgi:hypothetical protein